ncbi:MAG: flagellar motor switch protein FliG, partial [Dasania sp.]
MNRNTNADHATDIDAGEGGFLGKKANIGMSNNERAAIILYVLGPAKAAPIFEQLNADDHRAFAKSMHKMGFVDSKNIEETLKEYL